MSPSLRRTLLPLLVAVCCAPAPAQAALVELHDGELRVTAAPGEVNRMTVTAESSGAWTVADTGVAPSAGGLCTLLLGRVSCPTASGSPRIDLGDQGDTLTVTGTRGVEVLDGAGVDAYTGSGAADRFLDGAGADSYGRSGDDLFELGTSLGADVFRGESGRDRVSYLRASGAPGNTYRALYAYNHADWYVRLVLCEAGRTERVGSAWRVPAR